ncbi:MAG TPA: hypothetical protein VNQ99_14870 [Xanthobacteraceae bacterium]|nr:hypothetical protein [Xanthobacteraceae bacterium]
MRNTYLIETPAGPAGILVRENGLFHFCAAGSAFHALEGQIFRHPDEAEKAAIRHVTRRHVKSRGQRS